MLPNSEISKVFLTVGTQELHCSTLLQSQQVLRLQHYETWKKHSKYNGHYVNAQII